MLIDVDVIDNKTIKVTYTKDGKKITKDIKKLDKWTRQSIYTYLLYIKAHRELKALIEEIYSYIRDLELIEVSIDDNDNYAAITDLMRVQMLTKSLLLVAKYLAHEIDYLEEEVDTLLKESSE